VRDTTLWDFDTVGWTVDSL